MDPKNLYGRSSLISNAMLQEPQFQEIIVQENKENSENKLNKTK